MKNFSEQQPLPAHPLRIVVVDHELLVLKFVELVLQREIAQFTIKRFTNGSEAWQELSQADPDCLITEFALPGLSGSELLQRLLDRKAAYRIIVIAGLEAFRHNVDDFASRGLNVGFLSKPFTGEELRQAMGQPKRRQDESQARERHTISQEPAVTKAEQQASSLLAALELAGKPNYLGDPKVIHAVLCELANTMLRSGITEGDALARACKQASERAANIFLGQDSGYTPMPTWNCGGGIDIFIAKQLNYGETDSVRRMVMFFSGFLTQLGNLCQYAQQPSVTDDLVSLQVQAVMEETGQLLMGAIPPVEVEDEDPPPGRRKQEAEEDDECG